MSADLDELIRYNREGCKHPIEQRRDYTVWRGGSPGMIGGSRPVTIGRCEECGQDELESKQRHEWTASILKNVKPLKPEDFPDIAAPTPEGPTHE